MRATAGPTRLSSTAGEVHRIGCGDSEGFIKRNRQSRGTAPSLQVVPCTDVQVLPGYFLHEGSLCRGYFLPGLGPEVFYPS